MKKNIIKRIFGVTVLALSLCLILFSGCFPKSDKGDDELLTFSATFNDRECVYDGGVKNIYVSGAPSGTDINYVYELNGVEVDMDEVKNAGEYEVTAYLSKEGYESATLTATLLIKKADYSGLELENKTIIYDGTNHINEIFVLNAPESAEISYAYTKNGAGVTSIADVGTYVVTATVSIRNYKLQTLSATVTINARNFVGLTFENAEFDYDGTGHTIEVENLIDGATVNYTYTKNDDIVASAVEEGIYNVTAVVTKNGYNTQTLSATITIKSAGNQNFTGITFSDKSFDYDGTAKTITVQNAPYGANVTYTYFDANGQEVQSAVNAGEYTVTAIVRKSGFNDLTISAKLTIRKARIVGVIITDEAFTYDGEAKTIEATNLPSGATVTYGYASYDVSSGVSTPCSQAIETGYYFCTVTVSLTNYEDYVKTVSFYITEKQLENFTGLKLEPKTVTYDGTVKALSLSGISEELLNSSTVSYTYTLNGKAVEAEDVVSDGEYTVTATISKEGYKTKTLTATLTIEKASFVGLTLEPKTVTYDGNAHSITIKGDMPQGTTVDYSYELNGVLVTEAKNVGRYDVTATVSKAGYETVTKKATLVINTAQLTGLIFDGGEFEYDGTARTLEIRNVPNGAQVNYEIKKDGIKVTEAIDAGTYTVTATVSMPNYFESTLTATLLIKLKEFDVTLSDKAFDYDGTVKAIIISGDLPSGATVIYTYKKDGTTIEAKNVKGVGEYMVTAVISAKNYAQKTLTATLTINTNTEIFDGVIFENKTVTYDGKYHTVEATNLPDGTTTEYVYKKDGVVVTRAKDAGEYSVSVNLVKDGVTKTLAKVLTIEKATLSGFELLNSTRVYSGQENKTEVIGDLDGATVEYKYDGVLTSGKTDVGVYDVTATVKKPNYNDLILTATLTITKAQFDAVFADTAYDYDGKVKTIKVSGVPQGATVLYTCDGVEFTGAVEVGSYEVTALITSPNYFDKQIKATLTINEDTAFFDGVVFDDDTVTYDGTAHTLEATNLPDGTTTEYTYKKDGATVGEAKGAGVYTVTVKLTNDGNEKILSKTLTILRATLSGITLVGKTVTYDGTAKTIAVGDLPNGATVTYTYKKGGSQVSSCILDGEYDVTAVVSLANYEDLTLTATLTINPLEFTGITFVDAEFDYDGTKKTITATGIEAGANVSYTYELNSVVVTDTGKVGTYYVTLTVTKAGYKTFTKVAQMKVNALSLPDLTFESLTAVYDGNAKKIFVSDLPEGATVTYTYKKNGSTVSEAREVGEYTVTATVSKEGYTSRTFTATITITAPFDYTWFGSKLSLIDVKKLTKSGNTFVIGDDKEFEFDNANNYADTCLTARAGDYIKLSLTNGESALLNIYPNHIKSYYNELKGSGYVLSFYVYVSSETKVNFVGYYNYGTELNVGEKTLAGGKWHVISLDFDEYILATDTTSASGHFLDFDGLGESTSLDQAMLLFTAVGTDTVFVGNTKIELKQSEIPEGREPELNGIIWNELSESTITVRTASTTTPTDTTVTTEKTFTVIDAESDDLSSDSALVGKKGKYVKYVVGANQTAYYDLFMASGLSKDYFADKIGGKNYVLSFDFYSQNLYTARLVGYIDYNLSSGMTVGTKTVVGGEFKTVSLSFDNFILATSNASASGHYLDTTYPKNAKLNSNMFGVSVTASTVTYIGNFRIERNPDIVAQINSKTVDLNGDLHYALTNVLTTKEKQKLADYQADGSKISWSIKFYDGTTTVLDGLSDVLYITKENKSKIVGKQISVYAKSDMFSADGTLRSNTLVSVNSLSFTNVGEILDALVSGATSNVKILKYEDATDKLVDGSTVNISAFRNEYESAQFIINPDINITSYNVKANDLTCGQYVFGKENIQLFHELYQYVYNTYYSKATTGYYPDAIVPFDAAVSKGVNTINAGDNQGVWITVYIPEDQHAGTYTGTIELTLNGQKWAVPLCVKVYDYTLSEETHAQSRFSLNYGDIAYYHDETDFVALGGTVYPTVPQEILDNYFEYLVEYRVTPGGRPSKITSTTFYSSWSGRPYDTAKLFSFKTIKVGGVDRYEYEFPLVTIQSDSTQKPYTDRNYGIKTEAIDYFVNLLVESARDERIAGYGIPIMSAIAVNPNYQNIRNIYGENMGYGSWTEFHDYIPLGERYSVIDQYLLREYFDRMFKAGLDNQVDMFKKATITPTWVDEYTGNASKEANARMLLKAIKNFFTDCADWLQRKYNVTDAFGLSMLESVRDVHVACTAENIDPLNAEEGPCEFIPTIPHYNTQEFRDYVDAWEQACFGDKAEKWTYIAMSAGDTAPNYHFEDTPLEPRMLGWQMIDYDINGFLFWQMMCSTYLDYCYVRDENHEVVYALADANSNFVLDGEGHQIQLYKEGSTYYYNDPTTGTKTKASYKRGMVLDNTRIEIDDFYNESIHYGSIAGEGFMMYPGSYFDLNGPIGTIRLDAIRDGFEDFDLLYALKEFYKERADVRNVTNNFDNVYDRLVETLYTGVMCNIGEGYEENFQRVRDSLASMLVLADKYGIIVENAEVVSGGFKYTISAPSELNLGNGLTNVGTSNGGAYKIYQKTTNEDEFVFEYEGNKVTLSISAYKESKEIESLEWADISSNPSDYITYIGTSSVNSGSTVEVVTLTESDLIGTTAGTYYKVTPTDANKKNMIGFTLLPDHEKSYYEKYKDTANLVFDVYMCNENDQGETQQEYRLYYNFNYTTNRQALTDRGWMKITIPVADIVDMWDLLVNKSKSRATNWTSCDKAMFCLYSGANNGGTEKAHYYIGNFRFEHV